MAPRRCPQLYFRDDFSARALARYSPAEVPAQYSPASQTAHGGDTSTPPVPKSWPDFALVLLTPNLRTLPDSFDTLAFVHA